ncbi:MAG: hypothetical protein EA379_09015 [Phycisphaerales bacterium]|nr:MAG: hypothetical protein EA379_09015 [Phycisphaerales bacterium]
MVLIAALPLALIACEIGSQRDGQYEPESVRPEERETAPEGVRPEANNPPQAEPEEAAGAPEGMLEVFPRVRVDVARRIVEVDGVVPIDVNDPDAPDVYLELIACSPDTREHESLVVTAARPSDVHAALLMIGLEPGRPGAWVWEDDGAAYTEPEGDDVLVEIRYEAPSGEEIVAPAWTWVRNVRTGEAFPDRPWVFAGSRFVQRQGREWYDADGAGTLIGLCTFESETIAWPEVISPDSGVDEPVWIARNEVVPPFGTPATLILRPADR